MLHGFQLLLILTIGLLYKLCNFLIHILRHLVQAPQLFSRCGVVD
jgi:hypothetical protein